MQEWISEHSVKLIETSIIILIDCIILIILPLIANKIKIHTPSRAKAITNAFKTIINLFVIIVSFILILAIWGFDTFIAVVGLSLLIVILGIGARDLLSDIFSGIALIFSSDIEINDYVSIDGFVGKVIAIAFVKTSIQSKTGEIKTIRNSFIKDIINYKDCVPVDVIICTKNFEQIDEILLILSESLKELKDEYPELIEGPNVLGIDEITSDYINIKIMAKSLATKEDVIKRAIRKKALDILNKKRISL